MSGRWRRVVAATLGGLALLVPAAAQAHNVDGKVGVGYEETLLGLGARQFFPIDDGSGNLLSHALPDVRAAGLSGRWYVGAVGLEAVLGFDMRSPSGVPNEYGGFLSVGALWNVARAPSVNLAVGLRAVSALARTNTVGVAGPVRFGFGLELPIRVEYFFSPNFAIAGAVGPTLAINSANGNPLTGNRNSYEFALTRGDFGGGIGFTYYLN
ncbi:MAG: hypothetical protein HY902_15735 [Deltaproteobacteria bacterium]|nr:hypothetical protein [Deltaproteobacteria bacterium]